MLIHHLWLTLNDAKSSPSPATNLTGACLDATQVKVLPPLDQVAKQVALATIFALSVVPEPAVQVTSGSQVNLHSSNPTLQTPN